MLILLMLPNFKFKKNKSMCFVICQISHSTISGSPKESKFMETETERSALLAAIRGHSGISMLRKVILIALHYIVI